MAVCWTDGITVSRSFFPSRGTRQGEDNGAFKLTICRKDKRWCLSTVKKTRTFPRCASLDTSSVDTSTHSRSNKYFRFSGGDTCENMQRRGRNKRAYVDGTTTMGIIIRGCGRCTEQNEHVTSLETGLFDFYHIYRGPDFHFVQYYIDDSDKLNVYKYIKHAIHIIIRANVWN